MISAASGSQDAAFSKSIMTASAERIHSNAMSDHTTILCRCSSADSELVRVATATNWGPLASAVAWLPELAECWSSVVFVDLARGGTPLIQ
jgi:hypothetical protein